ncbi:MAG: hypothetical protein E7362_00260 [Clostridiales bacterium]|nr:hypothetical protein [Clostridiales bacterium]
MSRNVKKLTIILLSFVLSALLFVTGAMFIVSTSASTGNMQEYKEGKVKFEDRLWDESNYQVGSSNVIAVRDNATFTAKIQSTGSSLTANDYLTFKPSNAKIWEAYFIDGATFNDQVAKVFVYVGIPTGASATNKVPAVVCVHGGGGTAYSAWVSYWVSRGYAAIAMDTEGCIPKETASGIGQLDTDGTTATHPYHHGPENQAFNDVQRNNAIENHWFYQAVSSVIASRTFIGTFAEVDDSRIAITGISYGSYLTSMTCAYDYRYACAVPVYGSLDQAGTETYFGNNIRRNPWTIELWDDGDVLADCPVPFYYLMGNMDNHFSVTSTTSVAKKQGKKARMHIVNNFLHGHSPGAVNMDCGAGQQAGDVTAYIDSVCLTNPDYIQITQHPTRQDPHIKYELPSGVSIKKITLWYTTNLYLINNQSNIDSAIYLDYTSQNLTSWQYVDISLYVEGNTINIPVQAGSKHFYVNIEDNYGRGISSHVVAVNGEGPSYFEKLIKCDQSTNQGLDTYLDESAWWNDNNGWNNMPLDGNYYYVKEYNGAYPEILGTSSATNYGVNSLGYKGGTSQITLSAGARITNFTEFPVHKPIEFYYNFRAEPFTGQGWYTFNIFDTIEDTFTAQNLWHPAYSGAKFVMMGANYDQDPNIDIYYNLRAHDGGQSGNNNATTELVSPSSVTSSNWNTFWYKVRIEIGDTETKVYINDTLSQTMTSVTRSSFRYGMAYMVLEAQNSAMVFNYRTTIDPTYMLGSKDGREFSYEQDQNGWTTYKQNLSSQWYDAGNNNVKTYTGVEQSNYFGSNSHAYVGGVTKYNFSNTSYVMNYTKFDVTKPITFYYNVSTVADPTTTNGSWYNIGLFDTFERAFKSGVDIWHTTNKSKVVMFGSTSNKGADGTDRSANYNKLVLSRGGFGGQSTGALFENYNTSNWDDQWVKVTINIGTDKTTITVQGATTTTLSGNNSLTQSSFTYGYAYLGFSCEGVCSVNFRLADEEPALFVNKTTGAEFRDSFDENGFSKYIQQTTSQTIVDYKGDTAVGVQYGRVSDSNASSGTFAGYSNIKLNNAGWLVNGNAFDVTKPIRLIYQAKTNNEVNNFYTFALFESLAQAYKAGNESWNSANYVMNLRAVCTDQTQWQSSELPYGKMSIGANHYGTTHKYVYTTNSDIYPAGYANGWNGVNGFVYVDIIIGTTQTAVVVNGVTHYVQTTRSDFPSGYAYLSVANFADATIQMKVEQPESIQMNASLSLSSDIAVDFGVALNNNYVEPKVEVEFRGEKVTLDLHTFNHRLGQYIFEYAWVTPQYLSDTITMRLMAKTVDSNEYNQISAQTLTVRGYCQGLIEKYATTNTELTTLVVDFLNYGAVCQQFVNNDVENLANKNIDAYQGYASDYASLTAPTDVYESNYTSTDVGFSGAYLELGYDATMAFKVAVKNTVDVSTLHVDFTLDGAIATVAGENFKLTGTKGDYNVYTVKLNGISPTSFAKTVRASIKNSSDTEIAYCNYSVNTFIARKIASGSAVPYEIDLCKALYCLGVSALNYVG